MSAPLFQLARRGIHGLRGLISGSGGNIDMWKVRIVHQGHLPINILPTKFSKFPPLPQIKLIDHVWLGSRRGKNTSCIAAGGERQKKPDRPRLCFAVGMLWIYSAVWVCFANLPPLPKIMCFIFSFCINWFSDFSFSVKIWLQCTPGRGFLVVWCVIS